MRSVIQRAMGDDFHRLHRMVRQWFGFHSTDGLMAYSYGTADEVRRGGFIVTPFLMLGAMRNVMFPESGINVPFAARAYAFQDAAGRETFGILRTFDFGGRTRRFDEYIVAGDDGNAYAYLGTHQHFAVRLDIEVGPQGELIIASREQRITRGPLRFSFPRIFSADGRAVIGYDDAVGAFTIDLRVENRILGNVFSYRGTFKTEWRPILAEDALNAAHPRRVSLVAPA